MRQELVTVFGGSGFLGRHVVRALARAGYRVRVACRHPNKAFFLRPMGSVGQIAAIKCNVTEDDIPPGVGLTVFQRVFGGDVAAAAALCAGEPARGGRTYELGGPTVYSFRELVQIVLRETGRRRALLPIPFPLASLLGGVLQFLPRPLL